MFSKRMDITINDKGWRALKKLEKSTGIGKSELLRNSLVLLDFVEEKKAEGYKLFLISNKGIKHEIAMP